MIQHEKDLPYHTYQESLWREHTGPMVRQMLSAADYEEDIVERYEELFERHLAPALGPFPSSDAHRTSWKSFMTDDGTPLEFSFSFTSTEQILRLAIEPVGPYAGSALDPLNVASLDEFVGSVPDADQPDNLLWYRILRNEIITYSPVSCLRRHKDQNRPLSQFFTGFDLGRDKCAAKFYFLPGLKAQSLGKTSIQLLSDLVPRLEAVSGSLRPAFSMIESQFKTPNVSEPRLEIVSIDCCHPLESRLKLYIRTADTSFDKVWNFFTLGGKIQQMCRDDVYIQLKNLWYLTLGLPDNFPEEASLPAVNCDTAGTIFYFSLRAGSPVPEPKVYIPVRHYASSDLAVAQGMEAAFRKQGRHHYADKYTSTLTNLFPHQPLDTTAGLQTYISFSMKKGCVTTETYLAPGMELRHCKTERKPKAFA